MSDPNLGFIIAAYAIGFIVIAGMIAAVLYDRMNLKRALAKLSRAGANETEL
jgi:heme exporter protein CcmD